MRPALALLLASACTCAPDETTRVARTTITPAGGTFTLAGQVDGVDAIVLKDAEVRVSIDGTLRTTRGAACTSTATTVLDCELGGGLRVALARLPSTDGVTLRATVTATDSHTVEGFELVATPPGGLVLANNPDQLRYLHNGYQSWSFAGALDVLPGAVFARNDGHLHNPAPSGNVAFDEKAGFSSHDAIVDAGDGSALLAGFTTATTWHSAVVLEQPSEGPQLTAICGFTGDSVHVDATHAVTSEELLVQHAVTATEAMRAYGLALDAHRDTSRDAEDFGQRGWFTWNRYFTAIDEATTLAQAEALKALGYAGFDLVEIDDGWERAWGDWKPNAKFRSLAEVSATLRDRGQRLGLWFAPFVVDETLAVVADHPDWWVKTRAGQPLVHTPFGLSVKLRVVDTTHPDALAWAVENLKSAQRDGCDFFKLDFLYAAGLDGARHEPEATGAQALTRGLAAVFAALATSHVNLCGVPWLHAALSPNSSIRIGADVSFESAPPGFVYVATAARNAQARAFGPLARRSDVDQFLLAPLDAAGVRTALAWQIATAPTFALGDELTKLPASHRQFLDTAVGLARGRQVSGVDVRPFEDAGQTLLGSPVLEAFQDANVVQSVVPARFSTDDVTLFTNWGESAATLTVPQACSRQVLFGPGLTGDTLTLAPHDTAVVQLLPCD